jgi:hypothetical protein
MKHPCHGKIDTFTLLNKCIVAMQFNRAGEHDYKGGKIAPAFRLG